MRPGYLIKNLFLEIFEILSLYWLGGSQNSAYSMMTEKSTTSPLSLVAKKLETAMSASSLRIIPTLVGNMLCVSVTDCLTDCLTIRVTE